MNHASVPLSYDLLKEITNNFSEERKIGSGMYGRVYKGVYKDGKTIAVKMLYDMPGLDDEQFKREFNNLTSLQHDNIVRLVGYCHETRPECVDYNGRMVVADRIHRALCFEYAHNGSLHENLFDEYNGHDWRTRYGIIKGICNGLKYLHRELKSPMYHLDIKPANVLLDENMLPKIADFGLSRLFGQEQTKITISSIGTSGYLPPEFIEKHLISNKFDIFSLGVVIIKVMAGPLGYSKCGDMSSQEFVELVHGNWRARLPAPSICEPEPEAYYEQVKTCIEIALRCLEADRHRRPSITDIVDKMNDTETRIRLWSPREVLSQKESQERLTTKVEEKCERERLNDTGNRFGEIVDDYKLDQMARYMGRPKTQEDRAREALILVNKDNKDINAFRMDGNTNSTSGSGCKSCGPLTQYYIPDYILKPDSEQVIVDNAPCCPVVVFINSRSGGQLGSGLIKMYRELLNKAQVFDLSEESPDKVLHRLYANFEKLKSNGDILAVEIERKLRLIVAGGDGTASWLLGVVSDLKLSHPPPVAPLPLGTENNLPFSFGWGQKKPATDQEAAKSFLGLVKGAAEMNVDSCHIIMRMQVPKEGPCDPIAPLELPHSLHAFHRVSGSDSLNVEGYHTFRGGFWNYFSMGMDAQVSYGFHSERKKNPEFKIQGTYSKLGLKQGWFPSLAHPSSRNIAQLAKVKIMKRPGRLWEELKIPSSIRSIICLNLPSFSGGFNPWGTPGTRKAEDRDLTAPYVDDGLIEVVGFRDAWHGLVLLAPNGHGTRLAQAHRIRFEFHKGAADHTFMMVDGEPWKQPLPKDDETVVVDISHLRQVTMLANHPCKSKSIDDPTSPSHRGEGECDSDSLEDEDEWHEGRRKFGVADSFKLPDEVEIAHLS